MHQGEKKLHAWVAANMTVPGDRLDRIENVLVPGMFDANGCFDGVEFWLEYKAPSVIVKRSTTALFSGAHKFSVDQRNWGMRQRKAGGAAFVMLATESERLLLDDKCFKRLNEMTLKEVQDIAVWRLEKGMILSIARTTFRAAIKAHYKPQLSNGDPVYGL